MMVPSWGTSTLNTRCRSIIGIQKGTMILTTTHLRVRVFRFKDTGLRVYSRGWVIRRAEIPKP